MYVGLDDTTAAAETQRVDSRLKGMEASIARLEQLLIQKNSVPPATVVQQPTVQPVQPVQPAQPAQATGFMEQLKLMKDIMTLMTPSQSAASTPVQSFIPPVTDSTFKLETIERIAKMFQK